MKQYRGTGSENVLNFEYKKFQIMLLLIEVINLVLSLLKRLLKKVQGSRFSSYRLV